MPRSVDPEFPARMRALLDQRGLSYQALAAATFYGKSYLHRIGTGAAVPTRQVAERIDDALNAGGHLAGMVSTTPNGAPVDTAWASGETDPVQRRALLAAALAGLTLDPQSVTGLLAVVGDRAHAGATVDDWDETAREYGYAYLSAPRVELLRDVTADLAALQAALPGARGARRPGLAAAASRLAALVAMACTDLGYQREARATWRMARRYAGQSGSVDAEMWVRGQEATLGCYSDRPLPFVLELADQGLAVDRAAPVAGRAELLAARAQALARLGRADDALAALGPLRRAFDSLPDSVTSPTTTIYAWPHRRLLHTESFVYAHAGPTGQARRAHDEAIAECPPARVISRCQVDLHRAARLVRDGHIADGVAHARRVLDELDPPRRGRFVLTVADEVVAAVPQAAGRRADVIDLRDYLAQARANAS